MSRQAGRHVVEVSGAPMFEDRKQAGRQLAAMLERYRGDDNAVVLGIPRGGIIVAAEVARELGLPLDVAIAAKVGAPGNPEYAVGAVAADGVVTPGQSGWSASRVSELAGDARAKIATQTVRLRGGRPRPRLAGRTTILVDDGLATGLTAMAAADWLRREGAGHVVVAVPVAAPSAARALLRHADEVVAVELPEAFAAVGQFYRQFGQTEDSEVALALGLEVS